MRSLRGLVMMGAALWTLGMFALISIALTHSEAARDTVIAIHNHGHAAAIMAVLSMAAGFALVRGGLSPFDQMRRRLADVRNGTERQLRGDYPSEVQPLVDDLNALLSHNERVVTRAIAKAGDLAHGLKTPLAVLSNEAQRLAAGNQAELAATLTQQVSLMMRQVEYHLAHARAAASGATPGARCPVRDSADGLARTLHRLHADRGVTIDVNVSADHAVRGQRVDLDEMLGNLLDNACKWARSRVLIESSLEAGRIVITVDDDGAGLDPSMWRVVLQRGVRADEAAPGSGFGLAIVRELADVYGGSITLGHAPIGGMRARLELPEAGA